MIIKTKNSCLIMYFPTIPLIKPIKVKAISCDNVQIPIPRNKLDINIVIIPNKAAGIEPKKKPVNITNEVTGWMLGRNCNANLPEIANAASIAISEILYVCFINNSLRADQN